MTIIIRKGNWEKFIRRPVWSVCSSREISQVYNVSLITVNSWTVRNYLKPVSHPRLPPGNKNFFIIAQVRERLEGLPIEEQIWNWAHLLLPDVAESLTNLQQLENVVIAASDIYGLENPLLPMHFTI